MAYRKRWSIPFATMSGASAEIQILEKNYGEGLVETSVTPNQMRGYSFTPSDPTIQEAATLQRVVAYVLASEACSIRIEGSNSDTSFPVRLGTTNVAPAQDVAVSSIDTVNTSSFSKEVSLGAGQYLVIALDTNNVTLTLTKIASIADEDVEVITLQGAEQPFVTEEDNDIDLFMPVRTQSGYIRILTQEGQDVSELMPKSSDQNMVRFLIDGILMWQGWMKAENYSNDWDAAPYEIAYPVQCGVSVLKGKYLSQATVNGLTLSDGQTLPIHFGLVKIAQLLLECLEGTGLAWTKIVFPWDLSHDGVGANASNIRTALELMVCRWNFFTANDDDNTDDSDWSPYEAKDMFEVLESICMAFGFSLHTYRGEVHLTQHDCEGYLSMTYQQLIDYVIDGTFPTTTGYFPVTHVFDHDEIVSDDNTVEYVRGFKKITARANINAVGDVLPTIETGKLVQKGDLTIDNAAVGNTRTTVYRHYRLFEGKGKNFKAHWIVGSENEEVEYGTSEHINYVLGAIRTGTGSFEKCASLVELDTYTPDELENKYNYAIKKGILFTVRRSTSDWNQGLDFVLFEMESVGNLLYKNGAFVLTGSCDGTKLFPNSWGFVQKNNGQGHLRLSLQVGDKFWNGSAWQSGSCVFDVTTGAQLENGVAIREQAGTGRIVNTKTLSQPYNGADGYVIPITQPLSGIMKIVFHMPEATYPPDFAWDDLLLSDFKVSYFNDDSVTESDKDSNRYSVKTGATFDDDKSFELVIVSDNGNKSGYGILHNVGGTDYVSVLRYGGVAQRPELHLLNRMKWQYAQVREAISVDVETLGTEGMLVNPYDIFTMGDKTYAVLSRSTEWIDEKTTMILEEII